MSMNQKAVQVAFELTEAQAAALSDFLDFSTFSDFKKKARNDIDQAHNMADAASRLRKTLDDKTVIREHRMALRMSSVGSLSASAQRSPVV